MGDFLHNYKCTMYIRISSNNLSRFLNVGEYCKRTSNNVDNNFLNEILLSLMQYSEEKDGVP